MTTLSEPSKCRVAIVGLNQQRVARVISLLHNDHEPPPIFFSPIHQRDLSESDLPQEIPSKIEIDYLPCVATFDSYEDEAGEMVRYLVKLEYHGTLVEGKSLAPFFDDGSSNAANHFPGIAAVAIGCGIDASDDAEKIANFIDTLAASCQQVTNVEGTENSPELLVECIKCNSEFSSMIEENEAYRNLTEDEKKKAISNQTIGPGKMAKFVNEVAQKVVCQKWRKELDQLEQEKNKPASIYLETSDLLVEDKCTIHIPEPDKTRYACKRCRTVLFGEADLENPPHVQSLHNFQKKSTSKMKQSKVCANHFLANPLPWMTVIGDMEGKLHCFKCLTKIGHYSWTGAQCSCGTWVTPAIMIPMSKVDEVLPGSLFVNPSNTNSVIRMPSIYGAGAESSNVNAVPSLSSIRN